MKSPIEYAPTIIDLFAGAGGLSLGAARAGFRVIAAVENDKFAMETHKRNFPHCLHLDMDISKLSGTQLLNLVNYRKIDGLIGGPPCQGFSSMGKQQSGDERNDLFLSFFKLVFEIKPIFFLVENVPGILHSKYEVLRKRSYDLICHEYNVLPSLVIQANNYGVPTSRKRIFFIGWKKDSSFSLKLDDFAPPMDISPVFVKQALEGLPEKISPDWQSEKSGFRKIGPLPKTNYFNKIAGEIPPKIGDPISVKKYLSKRIVSGCIGTRHSELVKKRYEKLLQGEKDKISKSVKLVPNGYCPTLRAGTGKDKGSYQAVRPIHPTQGRVITPREAARFQGFPDWFIFHATKWHSFRQIGNSVSPIVAEFLLAVIRRRMSHSGPAKNQITTCEKYG